MYLRTTLLFLVVILELKAQSVIKFQDGNILVSDSEKTELSFVQRDFYVVDSLIKFDTNRAVDSVVDLSDQYVVPPLGDAHTHNLDRDWQLSFLPDQYFAEGTFYVLNLTSKADGATALRPYYARDSTVDVQFALQGWTSPLGHPFMAYEPFAMGLNDPTEWPGRMSAIKASRIEEGNSYIFAASVEEARRKLPNFLAQQPDVVKIYLVESDQYVRNSSDTIAGNNGLSPEVARYITEAAHQQGLRVFAHVDNTADFRLAVDIGVDCVAHVPGIGWNGNEATRDEYQIADPLIRKAVQNDVAVITTVQWFADQDSLRQLRKQALARDFLQRYHRMGGTILIGSDRFGATLTPEWTALADLDVFSPDVLLTIATSTTPRYIFPKRNIGFIRDGYEANFLVLGDNLLLSTEAIQQIEMKYKAGIKIK